MKLYATFILLAAVCLGTAGCAATTAHATPVAAAPPPQPRQEPSTVAVEEPISITQTNVVLPKPQPIQADALAVAPPEVTRPPEPSTPAAKPRVPAPRPEPRQQATLPPPQVPQPAPASPNPAASRVRIRPVESAAERNRLLNEVGSRQRQVQDFLAKAKARQLSDAEKGAAERIQAFLDQTEAALKDQDLQQAEALSNRALLLCQELNPGK